MVLNYNNNSYLRSKESTFNVLRVLAKQRNGLKICHINAQSLKNKTDEFKYVFENSGLDVICVSETWFTDSTSDALVTPYGYDIFRSDRLSHAGGVAIFSRHGLCCKLKLKSANNDPIEYVIVELTSNTVKCLVGCVYRPHRHTDISSFITTMENLSPTYEHIVIAGDFNCNILIDRSLSDVMESICLMPTNTSMPTHYSHSTNTLLDLFFVSDLSKLLHYDQISASCFSKHDLIYMVYDLPLAATSQIIQYRNLKNIDYGVLSAEFYKIDWEHIYQLESANEQLDFLQTHFSYLYNHVVPLTTKHINRKNHSWITPEIKDIMAQRDLAFSTWKRYKASFLFDEYKVLRNLTTKRLKAAKTNYFGYKFSSVVSSRKTWKTVREIGLATVKSSQKTLSLDPDTMNEQFTSTSCQQADLAYYENYRHDIQLDTPFSFRCVSQTEVFNSCLSIKSNAIGDDGIHPGFIKILLPYVLQFITHLFNTILTKSTFPDKWKCAVILPVPKTSSDYRPIAILTYLSKALEKIMHTQIANFVNENNLLSCKQSGFRPKHSCTSALLDVTEDLRRDIDCGASSLLVLLDHSKAFDTIVHAVLFQKLRNLMHFSSSSCRLVESYLTNRSQYVKISTKKSRCIPVTSGVPQGSILGPLLFSLYANDLPSHLRHCNIRMYADDVQLYISNKSMSFESAVEKLNSDLNLVSRWASINGLSINPSKSKCIVIRDRLNKSPFDPFVHINSERIEIVNKAKNLGVVFNNTLTWSDHIIAACGKTFGMLRTLWPLQYCTPLRIRVLLAKTYLVPVLLYSSEIFASCDSRSKLRLQVTFNSITRYVYGLKKRDRISEYVKMLFGVDFNSYLKIKSLILLHKIIIGKEPNHLYEKLSFSRFLRRRNLIPFRHTKLVSEWQFFISVIRLWNALPSYSKSIVNATLFKRALFEIFA